MSVSRSLAFQWDLLCIKACANMGISAGAGLPALVMHLLRAEDFSWGTWDRNTPCMDVVPAREDRYLLAPCLVSAKSGHQGLCFLSQFWK